MRVFHIRTLSMFLLERFAYPVRALRSIYFLDRQFGEMKQGTTMTEVMRWA
jgi:hypothetical protein